MLISSKETYQQDINIYFQHLPVYQSKHKTYRNHEKYSLRDIACGCHGVVGLIACLVRPFTARCMYSNSANLVSVDICTCVYIYIYMVIVYINALSVLRVCVGYGGCVYPKREDLRSASLVLPWLALLRRCRVFLWNLRELVLHACMHGFKDSYVPTIYLWLALSTHIIPIITKIKQLANISQLFVCVLVMFVLCVPLQYLCCLRVLILCLCVPLQ